MLYIFKIQRNTNCKLFKELKIVKGPGVQFAANTGVSARQPSAKNLWKRKGENQLQCRELFMRKKKP